MARASRSWHVVPGVVTATHRPIWGLRSAFVARVNYGVVVEYDYWYDGARYTGNRRHFTIWRLGGMSLDRALAMTRDRYPIGASVSVRVDPSHPGESVLESKADLEAVVTCFSIGALFLAAEIAFVLDLLGVIEV